LFRGCRKNLGGEIKKKGEKRNGRQRQTVVNGGTHATSCGWRR